MTGYTFITEESLFMLPGGKYVFSPELDKELGRKSARDETTLRARLSQPLPSPRRRRRANAWVLCLASADLLTLSTLAIVSSVHLAVVHASGGAPAALRSSAVGWSFFCFA